MTAGAPLVAGEGVLVIVPTYDERLNLERTLGRVRRAAPLADVLVVDDASPDGTGQLADQLASRDGRVHVLHRPGKLGLGAAYLAGFDWGLARGYQVLVEMDADGSHQPEQLVLLLEALGDAELVIGSRWVAGGRVVNWPWHRELLSRGGNTYARIALGIGLRDTTGGFRAFRRETLDRLDLDGVASQGYCFQVDLARRAVEEGCRVVEVPIEFVEREHGTSKMSGFIVREALWKVTVWGAARALRAVRGVRATPTSRASKVR